MISIIIPAYNSAIFIKETVLSALTQTISGFTLEAIVIDDGSTDDTANIAKGAGANVWCKKNGGVASSRNCGLNQAKGDYLLFLDGDDRLRPGALAALMKSFYNDSNLGAVFSMAQDFICPGLPVKEQARLRPRKEPYFGLLTGCMLVRRKTMESIGLFDETRQTGEAVEWLTRLYDRGIKTERIEWITADRRLHMSNIGRLHKEQEKKDYASILRHRYRCKSEISLCQPLRTC